MLFYVGVVVYLLVAKLLFKWPTHGAAISSMYEDDELHPAN